MHITKSRAAVAALCAAAALAACGGGGGDSPAPAPAPAPTSDIPASAQSSISGLIDYVNQLIAGTSDSTEPVLVGNAVLPVDDTSVAN